jgi:hypothetical protein
MARATRQGEMFQFSEDALKDIKRALGSHAPVAVPPLEAVVSEHFYYLTRPCEQGLVSPDTMREIKNVHAALQRVIERIDDVRPSTRTLLKRPVYTMGDLLTPGGSTPPAWQHLTVIHQESEQCAQRLKALLVSGRSLGRPPDRARRDLAEGVAIVLRVSGIPITASRGDKFSGGKFARVLSIVFSEFYGRPVQADFRLIKEVANKMRELTDSQLRQLIERVATYTNQDTPPRRTFWTLLASKSPQANE